MVSKIGKIINLHALKKTKSKMENTPKTPSLKNRFKLVGKSRKSFKQLQETNLST